MAYKAQLPSVNEAGKQLESEGLVAFGQRAFNQTADNCLAIASSLAEMLGYKPLSRLELTDKIHAVKSAWLWGSPLPEDIKYPSPVSIVVRTPDNPRDVHVTLEAYGREYNYGHGTREGFPVDMRIPLHSQPL